MSVSELMPEHPKGSSYTGSVIEDLERGQVNLRVSVVSPQEKIFEGDAHWITLPGADGQLGIWPRHVALVAALGSGPLRIGLRNHEVVEYLVFGSFLSIASDVVTILVDRALTKGEVDVAEATRELEETVAALNRATDDREFRRLIARRDWWQACLSYEA